MSGPEARLIEIEVDLASAGQRLDIIITRQSLGLSRSQVKALVDAGHIAVDGRPAVKAGEQLPAGARIRIEIPPVAKLDLTPVEVPIRVVYEDEDLAVLEKPAGLSVHPSPTEKGPTVVHGLLARLRSLSSIGGVERPGIVHRIDKGTSGVLVVSKTDATHAGLARQFKDHTIDRRYKALVYGQPRESQGRIETFYGRSPSNRKKMTGRLSDGRRAVTNWKLIESFGDLALIECRLETGRTHQIRVHLSELGHPIVGDPLYGDNARHARELPRGRAEFSRFAASLNHQLLHAFRLAFIHPRTAKTLEFESPLPDDFALAVALARKEAK